MIHYKIGFKTTHTLSQDQAREFWEIGEGFTSTGSRTYQLEARIEAEEMEVALYRAMDIVRHVVAKNVNAATIIEFWAEREGE